MTLELTDKVAVVARPSKSIGRDPPRHSLAEGAHDVAGLLFRAASGDPRMRRRPGS